MSNKPHEENIEDDLTVAYMIGLEKGKDLGRSLGLPEALERHVNLLRSYIDFGFILETIEVTQNVEGGYSISGKLLPPKKPKFNLTFRSEQ